MLGPDMLERDLERGLIDHLRDLILELGKGFAFVRSQYHLEIGGQDYYLDLVFYHLRLRCFVVFDLKIEEFKPEFAGKMNFYLSAVDDLLRQKTSSELNFFLLQRLRAWGPPSYQILQDFRTCSLGWFKKGSIS